MAQAKFNNRSTAHNQIIEKMNKNPDYEISAKELRQLEQEYRWSAPGVSDDPSMIDFFDTPRITLFGNLIRVWNTAYLAMHYSGLMKEEKKARIVEVGAGRGESYRVMISTRLAKGARAEIQLYDIDVRKKEFFNQMNPNKSDIFKIHDVRTGIPEEDNSCDVIFSTEFFEHIEKEEAGFYMQEAMQCLKEGGVLITTTPNASVRNNLTSIYHAYEWGAEELKSKSEEIGFETVDMHYQNVYLKEIAADLPEGYEKRISRDLLRFVYGIASGKSGATTVLVSRKPFGKC